ncbi:MAG: Uma2 family endonuclease [Phormidium sp. PBR-2020]|nr:MAG: Uma2 family endonuclease [Phormidium sp. PBR-2020]
MITLNLQPTLDLSHDRFWQLCQNNPDLRLERTAQGQLIAMAPCASQTGQQNLGLAAQLWMWNQHHQLGVTFDSFSGFTLPNGAIRAPDVAWLKMERWQSLPEAERRKFAAMCPDFVAELKSPTDSLTMLQGKLQEYLDNGAQLGWLLDPDARRVYHYCSGKSVQCLDDPETLSGEGVLPGLVVRLQWVWG